MKNERCKAECSYLVYGFAGDEYGSECWCSNSAPSQGTSTNCNKACNADPTTNCGGSLALNVWQLGGGYNLIKAHTRDNFCIDQTGSSTANSVLLQMSDCTGLTNQRWTYNSADGTIRVQNGGLCIDIPNGNVTNGQRLQQYACSAGNTNQQFIFNQNGDRTIRVAKNSTICLDVKDGNTANVAALQLYTCATGNTNQAWHIVS